MGGRPPTFTPALLPPIIQLYTSLRLPLTNPTRIVNTIRGVYTIPDMVALHEQVAPVYQKNIYTPNAIMPRADFAFLERVFQLSFQNEDVAFAALRPDDIAEWSASTQKSRNFCVLTTLCIADIYPFCLIASDDMEPHYFPLFPGAYNLTETMDLSNINYGKRGTPFSYAPKLIGTLFMPVDLTRDQFKEGYTPVIHRIRSPHYLVEGEAAQLSQTPQRARILKASLLQTLCNYGELGPDISPFLRQWIAGQGKVKVL